MPTHQCHGRRGLVVGAGRGRARSYHRASRSRGQTGGEGRGVERLVIHANAVCGLIGGRGSPCALSIVSTTCAGSTRHSPCRLRHSPCRLRHNPCPMRRSQPDHLQAASQRRPARALVHLQRHAWRTAQADVERGRHGGAIENILASASDEALEGMTVGIMQRGVELLHIEPSVRRRRGVRRPARGVCCGGGRPSPPRRAARVRSPPQRLLGRAAGGGGGGVVGGGGA